MQTNAAIPEKVIDFAAFKLAKAIRRMTEGEWEPNMRQANELAQIAVRAMNTEKKDEK